MPFQSGAPADRYVNQPTSAYSAIRILFSDATASYNIPVPAGCVVLDVVTVVGEAFDGTPNITVGDTTTAAGYLSNANVALATAGTAGTPAVVHSRDKGGAYATGQRYPASSNVIVAWTKGTSPTVGSVDIIVEFIKYAAFGIPAAVASTATL